MPSLQLPKSSNKQGGQPQPRMSPCSYGTALRITHLPVVLTGFLVTEDHWEKVNFNFHRYFPQVQETLRELVGTKEGL